MSVKELKKIILVEDEEDIRIIAQIALEDIGGFSVHYCSSGQEAIQDIETVLPDLILLDLMMPMMDGVATLRKIRQKKEMQIIPAIFLTAKTMGDRDNFINEPGVIGVIHKPFEPTTLSDDIRKLWNKHNETN